MTPERLAYLAGMLDAMGYVGIRNLGRGYKTPVIMIESMYTEITHAFADVFGGKVYRTPTGRGIWRVYGHEAQAVARLLYPYTTRRKPAFDRVTAWQSTMPGRNKMLARYISGFPLREQVVQGKAGFASS